jgi:hypothetical protein
MHLAGVGELDGVANEVQQHLREALFVSETKWEWLVHRGRERELLVLGERFGGRAHRLDHALDGILAHVEGELAGLDLAPRDSSMSCASPCDSRPPQPMC